MKRPEDDGRSPVVWICTGAGRYRKGTRVLAEAPGPTIVYNPPPEEIARKQLAAMDDGALVARAVLGDDFAFDMLMQRYAPIVVGFLRGRMANSADAEDVGQEVFLSAFRHLPNLKSSHRFGPWLIRIAHNRLIDYFRAQSRRPQLVGTTGGGDAAADRAMSRARDGSDSPHEAASYVDTRNLVLQEISRFPEKYRDILYLRLIGEESAEEIGLRLGLKPSTVGMRLCRGMKALRKALARQGIGKSAGQSKGAGDR